MLLIDYLLKKTEIRRLVLKKQFQISGNYECFIAVYVSLSGVFRIKWDIEMTKNSNRSKTIQHRSFDDIKYALTLSNEHNDATFSLLSY